VKLLLDTNIVVSMLRTPDQLSRVVEAALNDEANTLLVSSISIFELALKRSLGKLDVGDSMLTRLDQIGCVCLPLSDAHAWRVSELPWIHKDPFDRLIVAQALEEGVTLVTSDRMLSLYGCSTMLN
jgi:PIN domain nuclease of toxin-antitoxin system